MNKKQLRAKYKALRQELSDDEIEDKSLATANRMLQLDVWEKTYFHMFLTIEEQKEVETEFMLQILAGRDKEIVVAKSDFDTLEMTNYLLTDNTKFQKNEYNIFEPVDGLEVPVAKKKLFLCRFWLMTNLEIVLAMAKDFTTTFCQNARLTLSRLGCLFLNPKQRLKMFL